MNFENLLEQKVQEINTTINQYLFKEEGYQQTIFKAMNYSVLAGGKRIRPILLLETYRMMVSNKEDKNEALVAPFLTALEFIHTYSLVHDDLPAMDNDEYRRGKLTTHAAFGHAMGILAGDGLLNYAFEVSSSAFDMIEKMPQEEQLEYYKRATKAMNALAYYAGVYGMIGGQVVDVEQSGNALDLPMLQFVYELKTGALLKSAMLIGGILAGASKEELDCLELVAKDVGMSFQIQDDILDVTSTEEVLGKPIKSDEKNEKSTYVSLCGIEFCQNEVERLSNQAIQRLETLGKDDKFVIQLIQYLIHREK